MVEINTYPNKKKSQVKWDFRIISTSKKSTFQISSNRSETHYLNTHMQYVNHKQFLNSINNYWAPTMTQYDTVYWE